MSKDSYYFSHDSNASTDPKVLKLRMAFGWEGYGIFWAIIESMRNEEDYKLSSDEVQFLTLSLAIDEAKLKQILSKCLEFGLLVENDGKIYSESLLRRMKKADEIRKKRRVAGSKGGKAKANAKQLLQQTPSKDVALKETKVKETKQTIKKEEISFECFYKLYPKKLEEKSASIKWDRLTDEEKAEAIRVVKIYPWSDEKRYIPNPSNWLEGERWKDDLTPIPVVIPPNMRIHKSQKDNSHVGHDGSFIGPKEAPEITDSPEAIAAAQKQVTDLLENKK